jgi:hypothetical protein
MTGQNVYASCGYVTGVRFTGDISAELRLVFDDLGFRAYCDDLVKYQGFGDMDAMVNESRFRLFYEIGKFMFGRDCGMQALDFALHRIGQPLPKPVVPQSILDLKKFLV